MCTSSYQVLLLHSLRMKLQAVQPLPLTQIPGWRHFTPAAKAAREEEIKTVVEKLEHFLSLFGKTCQTVNLESIWYVLLVVLGLIWFNFTSQPITPYFGLTGKVPEISVFFLFFF